MKAATRRPARQAGPKFSPSTVADIKTLAGELVDELMSAPGPTRAEAVEYATGVLSAVALYHARSARRTAPGAGAELFWYEAGIMSAVRWLARDGNKLTAADMLAALLPDPGPAT